MSNERQSGYFGLKNAKYSFMDDTGEWGAPIDMPFAQSLSLTTKINTATNYADNRLVNEVPSDTGYEGTFGLSSLSTEYEEALGYVMKNPDGGILQLDAVRHLKHCIYFETEGIKENNDTFVIKAWLYNVTVAKSGKNYTTKGENLEFGKFELPVKILGAPLLDDEGKEFRDDTGHTRNCYMFTSRPGDTNYDDFGDTVPEAVITVI